MDLSQPLTEAEFRELDDFLMTEDMRDESMDISMLDGFLTALVIGPTGADDRWQLSRVIPRS